MTSSEFLIKSIVAAGALAVSLALAAPASAQAKKKVLFLTKSSGFEHSVVKRNNGALAHVEKIVIELGAKNGFEVTCSKDASLLNDPETYKKYDLLMFYTTGDLTKDSKDAPDAKGMTKEGYALMLKAIEDGKGAIGIHAACDTFASRNKNARVRPAEPKDDISPYVCMMGADFAGHGSQQKALIKVAEPKFPGLEDLKDFEMTEEWYSLNNLAPDMDVLLVQDTESMKIDPKTGKREGPYQRPAFPETWARMNGKGRVFYTSLGHREDVCAGEIFAKVLLAGMNWTAGNTQYDPKPNMEKVCPQQ